MHSLSFYDGLWHDIVQASRGMARRRGVTALAVIVLALGIGASAAVFSVIDGVLLQPLPYRNPSHLVAIWDKDVRASGTSKNFDSFADFREVAQHAKAFDGAAIATWAVDSRVLSGHGHPQTVLAVPVSESFFSLLGVSAAIGRTFTAADLTDGCAVVLSHRLWSGPLGADPALVGSAIALDDQACTVVGVMPPGFAFYPDVTGLWVLLTPRFSPARDSLPVGIFARLRDGVHVSDAQREVAALHAALHRADGRERDLVPVVYGLQEEFTFLAETELKTTLWVLAGAVGLVLLIACLNIASLLLAQGVARHRELAVRVALGCSEQRMVRQLLTEALVLALVGGLIGVALAFAGVRYFHARAPVEMPIGSHVTVNSQVLAFALLASVGSALVFGLLPAWRASRAAALAGLKSTGREGASKPSRHLVRSLVTAEMALSIVLLVGAMLLLKSVFKMSGEPLGFRANGLAVTGIVLPADRYSDPDHRLAFYERLASRLGERAVIATSLPPYSAGNSAGLRLAGATQTADSDAYSVGERTVGPGYFELLGISLLRGRTFDGRDRATTEPVALIGASIARGYFHGTDPIGQRIRVGGAGPSNPWRTIVGVVADEKTASSYHQIGWVTRPEVFEPLSQDPPRAVSVALRGTETQLQRAIEDVGGGAAIGEMETMQARLGLFLAYPRFRATLLGAFAIFALLLAATGLYGVLRQFVAQRTREIGVRMTVGATPGDVLRLVSTQAARPVVLGLVGGVGGALVLSRFLTSLLYQVWPADPVILLGVCGILLGIAGLATWLPAQRAIGVDPAVALRAD